MQLLEGLHLAQHWYSINVRLKIFSMPWLVWLSGLSAGLQLERSLVQVPVRAHAWVVGQVPSWAAIMDLLHIDVSPHLFLSCLLSKSI